MEALSVILHISLQPRRGVLLFRGLTLVHAARRILQHFRDVFLLPLAHFQYYHIKFYKFQFSFFPHLRIEAHRLRALVAQRHERAGFP